MKRISLIAPQGEFSMVNLDLSRQLFQWVNENAPSPIFNIEIEGLTREVTTVITIPKSNWSGISERRGAANFYS